MKIDKIWLHDLQVVTIHDKHDKTLYIPVFLMTIHEKKKRRTFWSSRMILHYLETGDLYFPGEAREPVETVICTSLSELSELDAKLKKDGILLRIKHDTEEITKPGYAEFLNYKLKHEMKTIEELAVLGTPLMLGYLDENFSTTFNCTYRALNCLPDSDEESYTWMNDASTGLRFNDFGFEHPVSLNLPEKSGHYPCMKQYLIRGIKKGEQFYVTGIKSIKKSEEEDFIILNRSSCNALKFLHEEEAIAVAMLSSDIAPDFDSFEIKEREFGGGFNYCEVNPLAMDIEK